MTVKSPVREVITSSVGDFALTGTKTFLQMILIYYQTMYFLAVITKVKRNITNLNI